MWFWHNTSAGHLRPRRCCLSAQPDEAHTHGLSFCVLRRECMRLRGHWWSAWTLQHGSYPLLVVSPVSLCMSGRNRFAHPHPRPLPASLTRAHTPLALSARTRTHRHAPSSHTHACACTQARTLARAWPNARVPILHPNRHVARRAAWCCCGPSAGSTGPFSGLPASSSTTLRLLGARGTHGWCAHP